MNDLNIVIYKENGSILADGFFSPHEQIETVNISHHRVLDFVLTTFSTEQQLRYIAVNVISGIERLFSMMVTNYGEFVFEKRIIKIEVKNSVGDLLDTILYVLMADDDFKSKRIFPCVKIVGDTYKKMIEKVPLSGFDYYRETYQKDENNTGCENIIDIKVSEETKPTEDSTVSDDNFHIPKNIVLYMKSDILYCHNGIEEFSVSDVNDYVPRNSALRITWLLEFITKFPKSKVIQFVQGVLHEDEKQDIMWANIIGTMLDKLGYTFEYYDKNPLIDYDEYKPVYIYMDPLNDSPLHIVIMHKDCKSYMIKSPSLDAITTKLFRLVKSNDAKYNVIFYLARNSYDEFVKKIYHKFLELSKGNENIITQIKE